MKYKWLLILLASVLSACTQLPDYQATPQAIKQSAKKVDARLGSVSVELAPEDERQGYLSLSVQTVAPIWRDGVVDALKRSAVFSSAATRQLNLEVRIIKLDTVQNSDLSTTATATATYRLLDAMTHEVLWVRGITEVSTVTYQENAILAARERIALNTAIQNNIAQFVLLYGQ